MNGLLIEPTFGEIDGVPLVHMPMPGPTTLALIFRGGIGHETLPKRGVAHLAEHLALYGLGSGGDSHHNGHVESVKTVFHVTGSPDDVIEFTANLVPALSQPSGERVESEKAILRVEASRRGWNADHALRRARFGLHGHGLVAVREFGLSWIGSREVEEWQALTFVRRNAVVVVTGELPSGLRLELPEGASRNLPPSAPIEGILLPSSAGWSPPFVGFSMVGERSAPLNRALGVLTSRLTRRLRYELGLVYAVEADYSPLTPSLAHVSAWTESKPTDVHRVRVEMISELDRIRREGPTEEEARMGTAQRATYANEPAVLKQHAHYAGEELLLGHSPKSREALLQEAERVGPDQVAEALQSAAPSTILGTPDFSGASSRFPISRGRFIRMAGRHYQTTGMPIQARDKSGIGRLMPMRRPSYRLTIGAEGVSLERTYPEPKSPDDIVRISVEWKHLVGYARTPTSRVLYPDFGSELAIDQADWRGGAQVIAELDRVAPEAVQFEFDSSLVPGGR